jgi:hypothetical protein
MVARTHFLHLPLLSMRRAKQHHRLQDANLHLDPQLREPRPTTRPARQPFALTVSVVELLSMRWTKHICGFKMPIGILTQGCSARALPLAQLANLLLSTARGRLPRAQPSPVECSLPRSLSGAVTRSPDDEGLRVLASPPNPLSLFGRLGSRGYPGLGSNPSPSITRFFTSGQRGLGDRHVHASRTRFIPDDLPAAFRACGLASDGTGRRRRWHCRASCPHGYRGSHARNVEVAQRG